MTNAWGRRQILVHLTEKEFMKYTLILAVALSGCATNLIGEDSNLSVALHSDIEAAAQYAEANGYPERAAVRRAIAAQLKSCEAAISQAKPKIPEGKIGPILLAEMLEERAGEGVPARVKILCAPMPLFRFPGLG